MLSFLFWLVGTPIAMIVVGFTLLWLLSQVIEAIFRT